MCDLPHISTSNFSYISTLLSTVLGAGRMVILQNVKDGAVISVANKRV